MPTRRAVVRSLGTAAAGIGLLSGTATAQRNYDIPEPVTISFDQTVLEAYRPKLVTYHLNIEPNAWYGWTARSPDRDTVAHVYWAEYPAQEGVTSYDSHLGDHEPVIVFTDPSSGDVQEVVASVYHWLRGRFVPPSVPIVEGDHPALQAARPWHHYRPDPAHGTSGGQYYEVRDLRQHFDAWLANGLQKDLNTATCVNPWIMQGPTGEPYWWSDFAAGFSIDAARWGVFRAFNLYEGSYP